MLLGGSIRNSIITFYYILNLKQTIMIYFFSSSRKDDKLTHPVTVSTNSERRAYALAIVNFKKHHLIGSPKLTQI